MKSKELLFNKNKINKYLLKEKEKIEREKRKTHRVSDPGGKLDTQQTKTALIDATI